MPMLELAANAAATLSIGLAAFNHVLTWPVGIAGCVLFAFVFHGSQLFQSGWLRIATRYPSLSKSRPSSAIAKLG